MTLERSGNDLLKKITLIGRKFFIIVSIFCLINSQTSANVFYEDNSEMHKQSSDTLNVDNFSTERTNWNLSKVISYDDWQLHAYCIYDDYLFIAGYYGYNGLFVINISDILDFYLMGGLLYNFDLVRDMIVYNNYLYVIDIDLGLVVFDVSDLTNPTFVTEFKDNEDAHYSAITITDSYAYIAEPFYGMKVLNISSLSSISIIGSLNLGKIGQSQVGFCKSGDFIYLGALFDNYIGIINVSDPTDPLLMCNYTRDYHWAYDIYVEGNTLYYCHTYGFHSVNITDKENPVPLDDWGESDNWGFRNMEINGTEAFLIDGKRHQFDLQILDISNPENIQWICSYDTEAEFDATIKIKDEYIISYAFDTGFEIISFDYDNDGLADILETDVYGTDPNNPDTDGDLMPDYFEVNNSLNALVDDSEDDEDSDGLSNLDEYNYDTNPNKNDTDNDNLNDYQEIFTFSTDPNNADSDEDGLLDGNEILLYNTDPLDEDSDDDQLSDYDEQIVYFTDPLSNDTDTDLLNDYEEIIVYGTNPLLIDTDEDGYSDYEEIHNGTDPLDANDPPTSSMSINIIIFGLGISTISGLILAVNRYQKKQKTVEK